MPLNKETKPNQTEMKTIFVTTTREKTISHMYMHGGFSGRMDIVRGNNMVTTTKPEWDSLHFP